MVAVPEPLGGALDRLASCIRERRSRPVDVDGGYMRGRSRRRGCSLPVACALSLFAALALADMAQRLVYRAAILLLPSQVLCTLVSPAAFVAVLAAWGLLVWWLLFRSGLRSKELPPNRALAALLADYIRSNRLCEFKSDGGANAPAVLASSAIMRGEYTPDGFITVDFYKLGDAYTEKASRQAEGLSALLSRPLDSLEDGPDRCRYRFRAVPDTRLNAVSMLLGDYSGERDRIRLTGSLSWRFAKLPHALVAGGTGGGKSTFLYYLLGEFLRLGDASGGAGEVFVCDPKNAELASLSRVFGPDRVGTTPGQIAKVVRRCRELMDERYRYMNDPERFRFGASAFDYGLNPVFLVFDEVAAFRAEADKKTFGEVWDNVTQLVLKARAANVFVVLAVQQPRAEVISTDIRDNLGLRVSLGDLSDEGYRMVYGSGATGYRFHAVTERGTGYVQLDGWNAPKPFAAPFADYSGIDYPTRLAELYEAAQARNGASSAPDAGDGGKGACGHVTGPQETG